MHIYVLRLSDGAERRFPSADDEAACHHAQLWISVGDRANVWQDDRLVSAVTGRSRRLADGAWELLRREGEGDPVGGGTGPAA